MINLPLNAVSVVCVSCGFRLFGGFFGASIVRNDFLICCNMIWETPYTNNLSDIILIYCDLKASFVGFAVGAGMTRQADNILQDTLSHLYSNALFLKGILLLFGNLVIMSTKLKNTLH